MLKWDMVQEGLSWFSAGYGGWPTQNVVVNVQQSPGMAFLPKVQGNNSGWNSTIVIRNNSSSAINATVTFYNTNGAPVGTKSSTAIGGNGALAVSVADVVNNFMGSAVVVASNDVAVDVENQNNNQTERTNYNGVLPSGSSGSPGWEQTGTTLYAPAIKRQRYGRSSAIYITNASAQSTGVYVVYYDSTGVSRSEGPLTLNPNGAVLLFPGGSGSGGCNSANTICSAKIYSTNGQPLAGVVQEYNDSNGLAISTHNLFSTGATSIYFPLVKYTRYNMSTGLRIQNVGAPGTTITVNYYQKGGIFQCSLSQSAASLAAMTFYDSTCPGNNFAGSAVATANQALVGMAHETSTDGRYSKGYSSFLNGSHTAYGPLVYHTYPQNGYTWDSGIAVQNLSSQPTNVNLYYYDTGGNPLASNPQSSPLTGRGMAVFFAPQSGFKGSVIITANQDIVAIVNVVNNAPSGDTHATYNASNR